MARILYVEDNLDTASAVKTILSNAGYEVEVANNGKEGVTKASKGFDLFLLDIMLPDMSGWDIFETLRKKANSRFAFLSAIPISNERLEELKSAGVSDYITKPFTKEDLLWRIGNIVNK
jgi:DNA-binding response OmpR family regulator